VHGAIDKFSPIIRLNGFYRKAELSASIANKVNYVLMNLGLVLEGKSPAKVHKITQDSQVIRTTRNTSH
jgi:hypothetical protein